MYTLDCLLCVVYILLLEYEALTDFYCSYMLDQSVSLS